MAFNFRIAFLNLPFFEIVEGCSNDSFCQALTWVALKKIVLFYLFHSQETHSVISFLYTFAVKKGILSE